MENNSNNQEVSKDFSSTPASEPSEPIKVKGSGMHPNSIKNMQKAGEPGHNPKGRPKGARNRATVLRELMDVKVTRYDPKNPAKQKKMTLYEAAALGQFFSAEKGNTHAWKEIQDSLHGPMPQKIQGEFEFTFASLAKEAALELNRGIDYESEANGYDRYGNGIGEEETTGDDLVVAIGPRGQDNSNGHQGATDGDAGSLSADAGNEAE